MLLLELNSMNKPSGYETGPSEAVIFEHVALNLRGGHEITDLMRGTSRTMAAFQPSFSSNLFL